MHRKVLCLLPFLLILGLFGCAPAKPSATATPVPTGTHSTTPTPTPTPTQTATITLTPTPTVSPELEARAEALGLVFEYNQTDQQWILLDEQGQKLGNIIDEELVLVGGLVNKEAFFLPEQMSSMNPVELSAFDAVSLLRMGITPVTSGEGFASITNGENVFLPVPEGAEAVENNEAVVRLSDGSLMINRFILPEGFWLFHGTDNNTGRAVVVVKNENGEFLQPKPIEYEAGFVVEVIPDGDNTAWVVASEGETSSDRRIVEAQNLLISSDQTEIEGKKPGIIDKLSRVHGLDLKTWPDVLDLARPMFEGKWFSYDDGQNYRAGDYVGTSKEAWQAVKGQPPVEFPNRGIHFEALGVDWDTVYIEELGIELVRVFFINPTLSDELMSMYVGYVEGDEVKDFIFAQDDRTDDYTQDYAPHRDKGGASFVEFLDALTTGDQLAHYYVSVASDIPTSASTDYEKVFAEYAQGDEWPEFDPGPLKDLVAGVYGTQFRVFSKDAIRKLRWVPGLLPDELLLASRGLNPSTTFIGQNIAFGVDVVK